MTNKKFAFTFALNDNWLLHDLQCINSITLILEHRFLSEINRATIKFDIGKNNSDYIFPHSRKLRIPQLKLPQVKIGQ